MKLFWNTWQMHNTLQILCPQTAISNTVPVARVKCSFSIVNCQLGIPLPEWGEGKTLVTLLNTGLRTCKSPESVSHTGRQNQTLLETNEKKVPWGVMTSGNKDQKTARQLMGHTGGKWIRDGKHALECNGRSKSMCIKIMYAMTGCCQSAYHSVLTNRGPFVLGRPQGQTHTRTCCDWGSVTSQPTAGLLMHSHRNKVFLKYRNNLGVDILIWNLGASMSNPGASMIFSYLMIKKTIELGIS